MPATRPAHTIDLQDDKTLQIRSRREKDLNILREEYMGDALGETMATPGFDYNFRAYCTPEAWGEALYEMSVEIDYSKFKPTTARYEDDELHEVYNSMWATVCRLNAPWSLDPKAKAPVMFGAAHYGRPEGTAIPFLDEADR